MGHLDFLSQASHWQSGQSRLITLTTPSVVQVAKPSDVAAAEQSSSPATDDELLAVLTAFNVGVSKASRAVRTLLPDYGGYECKEPEPGKFTLAFRCTPSSGCSPVPPACLAPSCAYGPCMKSALTFAPLSWHAGARQA